MALRADLDEDKSAPPSQRSRIGTSTVQWSRRSCGRGSRLASTRPSRTGSGGSVAWIRWPPVEARAREVPERQGKPSARCQPSLCGIRTRLTLAIRWTSPFPPALAAEGREPVALDVHRYGVVVRAAARQRGQVAGLVGAADRLPAVPADPVAGLEDSLAAGGRNGAALGREGAHQASPPCGELAGLKGVAELDRDQGTEMLPPTGQGPVCSPKGSAAG